MAGINYTGQVSREGNEGVGRTKGGERRGEKGNYGGGFDIRNGGTGGNIKRD